MELYAIAGELPGNLPLGMISTDDWLRRCVAHSQDLAKLRGESQERVRSRFAKLAYQRMFRYPGRDPVPASLGFDVYWFRTVGEVEYGYQLAKLKWAQWNGRYLPVADALCFEGPILLGDFRYVHKFDVAPEYWEKIKWERRQRARFGYLVPLQNIEIEIFRHDAKHGRYVPVHAYFHRFETLLVCWWISLRL